MRQVGAGARQLLRIARRRHRGAIDRPRGDAARRREHAQQRVEVLARDGLVQRDADDAGTGVAQIDAGGVRRRVNRRGVLAGAHRQRVEVGLMRQRPALRAQRVGQQRGVRMHALRDARQPLRAVVDRIHAGDHRRQHLRGADVARRLLAADVLLARLQRQAQRRLAVRVDADADQTPGHLALERVAHRHVGGVRAAEAQRQAEALRAAHGDVGAEFARRRQHGQREDVGGDDDQRAALVRRGDELAPVVHPAVDPRILQQHRGVVGLRGLRRGADDDLDPQRTRSRVQHLERLRQQVVGGVDAARRALAGAQRQRHRLGRSGGLVEHRRVGHVERGEVGDHGLEVDQRLQAPLADLGLVRRVRGVPGRVLEHVALDDAGQHGPAVALADEIAHQPVAAGDLAQFGERAFLADRGGQIEIAAPAQRVGYDRAQHRVEVGVAEQFQHQLLLFGAGADVAAAERRGVFEFGEGRGAGHGGAGKDGLDQAPASSFW
ncbi:hypothetical protein GALL_436090 [mine drainage metagenome]|uniref:Uncharacterized protein n=1 Tax=mine drainage metagenome TaxID=410659 RepID=A0A1J5QB58_9ZZZZ